MKRKVVRQLKSLIYLNFDSESDCAAALGWKRQTLSKITNGHREPTLTELNGLAKVLHSSVETLSNFF